MQLPQEVIDNIFSYLPSASLKDVNNYAKIGRTWYQAAKRSYYKTLNINENVNVNLLLKCLDNFDIKYFVINVNISNRSSRSMIDIADEVNSFILFDNCENIKKIHIKSINPFFVLNSIKRASLTQVQEIKLDWSTLNHSPAVNERFYAANYQHKNTINTLSLPANDNNDNITFALNGKNYDFTKNNYAREFVKIRYYTRADVLAPIPL